MNLPDQISVSFSCPPMKVSPVSFGLRITDPEPMVFTAGDLVIKDVTIPPTNVRAVSWPFQWMVDACSAEQTDGGAHVRVDLPPEPVSIYPFRGFCIAEAIDAPVTLVVNGETWQGTVKFPDCRVPLYTGVAESVTATGMVTKVKGA